MFLLQALRCLGAHSARTPKGKGPIRACLKLGISLLAFPLACAGTGVIPGDPVAPPPSGAWRPGEALAYVLKPRPEDVRPIDSSYLERTQPYRVRIAEAEALADSLRRIEKLDRGGRREWFFSGADAIFLRIDIDNDGTVDQTQYFGPEGLFAIVHRFSSGRRTQRVYWPPGETRIVEIRDNLPPYPGIWWRTSESPFERQPEDSAPGEHPKRPPPPK